MVSRCTFYHGFPGNISSKLNMESQLCYQTISLQKSPLTGALYLDWEDCKWTTNTCGEARGEASLYTAGEEGKMQLGVDGNITQGTKIKVKDKQLQRILNLHTFQLTQSLSLASCSEFEIPGSTIHSCSTSSEKNILSLSSSFNLGSNYHPMNEEQTMLLSQDQS